MRKSCQNDNPGRVYLKTNIHLIIKLSMKATSYDVLYSDAVGYHTFSS
jgi:hypothetical protein